MPTGDDAGAGRACSAVQLGLRGTRLQVWAGQAYCADVVRGGTRGGYEPAGTDIALAYGVFGLLLGVLVRDDLEGFFLITR